MICIKKILLKIFVLFIFFFLFDINKIDSNSDKALIYSTKDIYEEDYYTIYFKNFNSDDMEKIQLFDIEVLSYIIDDKKYYLSNESIVDVYTENMSIDEKSYYDLYGVKIDGLNVVCEVNELMKLENVLKIY